MKSSISTIIPVHNGRPYLRATVESVLAQTRLPDELLLVDDGSTDGSLEALDGLAAPFPVRRLRQENLGQSAARNAGVREASGELIAFLDQDDLWEPGHLQALASRLERDSGAGWAYSDFSEIDNGGHLVTRGFLRHYSVVNPKGSVADCIARDLMVIPSASLLRKEAIAAVGGFDEALQGYEDDDLFVRIFRAGWTHSFIDAPTARFRIHGESSSASLRFIESRRRYARKLKALLPDDPRMRRYYVRDLIAPRFLNATLDDYVRACSRRDWAQAEIALEALEEFVRLRPASLSRELKLFALRSPRLFRGLVALNDGLPAWLRPIRNPAITLR